MEGRERRLKSEHFSWYNFQYHVTTWMCFAWHKAKHSISEPSILRLKVPRFPFNIQICFFVFSVYLKRHFTVFLPLVCCNPSLPSREPQQWSHLLTTETNGERKSSWASEIYQPQKNTHVLYFEITGGRNVLSRLKRFKLKGCWLLSVPIMAHITENPPEEKNPMH